MKASIYVILDTVAEESGPLFEAKNDGVALRNFAKIVKDNEFGHEFKMFRVGWYDHNEQTGGITSPFEVLIAEEREDE